METLPEPGSKIKWFSNESLFFVFLGIAFILVALGSFGLGRLSIQQEKKESITIEYPPYLTPISADTTPTSYAITTQAQDSAKKEVGAGKYVASKNGTRYYLPACGGVSRIKEENKVWFNTKEEAEARGLTPAANCPGI